MPQADKTKLVEIWLVRLLDKRNNIIDATANLQTHILAMLLVEKRQVYPPVLELGLQAMGRTPAVERWLSDFLDYALLLKHPLVLDIKQGGIKLPGHMTAQVKRDDMQHQGCWLDTNALVQCTRSGTTCCQQHLC